MIIKNLKSLKKSIAYYTAKYPKTATSLDALIASLENCVKLGPPIYDDLDDDDPVVWVVYGLSDECPHRGYYFTLLDIEPEAIWRYDGTGKIVCQ